MGVEIDRCPKCGGIWLDGGEIKELVARRRSPAGDAQLEAAIDQLSRAQPLGGTRPMVVGDAIHRPCPACAGKLTNVYFAQTQIEHCNKCQGVFLDRGELARAMQLVDSNEATTIMALAASVTTSGTIG